MDVAGASRSVKISVFAGIAQVADEPEAADLATLGPFARGQAESNCLLGCKTDLGLRLKQLGTGRLAAPGCAAGHE